MLSKNNYTSRKFLLSTIYSLILLQSKGGKKETILEKTEKKHEIMFHVLQ